MKDLLDGAKSKNKKNMNAEEIQLYALYRSYNEFKDEIENASEVVNKEVLLIEDSPYANQVSLITNPIVQSSLRDVRELSDVIHDNNSPPEQITTKIMSVFYNQLGRLEVLFKLLSSCIKCLCF
jgi:hypothetical protein